MSEHEHKHDPWADLADTLGAKPVGKPAEPPPAASAPPPPAARPPQKLAADKPAAAPRSDWGGLESALGLPPAPQRAPAPSSGRPQPPAQPTRSQPPPAQSAREAVEPPPSRREREQDDFSFGDRRPVDEPAPRQGREPLCPPRDPVARRRRRPRDRRRVHGACRRGVRAGAADAACPRHRCRPPSHRGPPVPVVIRHRPHRPSRTARR